MTRAPGSSLVVQPTNAKGFGNITGWESCLGQKLRDERTAWSDRKNTELQVKVEESNSFMPQFPHYYHNNTYHWSGIGFRIK